MRIRHKKWARPELEACPFYRDDPEKIKGKWREEFTNPRSPFYIELGCGKGQFISQLALQNQTINYLAIDLVDAMLGLAKRNVEQTYKEQEIEPKNLLLTRFDIERILLLLDKNDEVDRIYINFCNPWPRGRTSKKEINPYKAIRKISRIFKSRWRNLFQNR